MQHITIDSARYPERLKMISSPPKQLFIEGNSDCLSKPCIAIVGTRKPSHFALKITEKWSKALSEAGIVVISGLALGIDGAAHRGALMGQAKTIAVLGCGLNIDYPKQHHELKKAIIDEGGCLISEYPNDSPPNPKHFPHRNRIISGLSDGIVVMEAALRSGSLVTAKIAIEQGKEVMAVPGNIHNPMAQGCHWLIRQGATLVSSIEEVAECIKSTAQFAITQNEEKRPCQKPPLLAYVHDVATPIDEIVSHSGLAFHEVCSILVELEISGYVEKVIGGYRLSST